MRPTGEAGRAAWRAPEGSWRPRRPELRGPVSEHAGTSGEWETEMDRLSEAGAIAGSKEPRTCRSSAPTAGAWKPRMTTLRPEANAE